MAGSLSLSGGWSRLGSFGAAKDGLVDNSSCGVLVTVALVVVVVDEGCTDDGAEVGRVELVSAGLLSAAVLLGGVVRRGVMVVEVDVVAVVLVESSGSRLAMGSAGAGPN